MASFTPNTGGTVNWDTLSGGSTNATLDTYTISANTTLLIDTDSYQCANHSTAFGSLDTVTFTGQGGKLRIDGTSVRVIPYNTGTGNVPAIGTTISQGGVSSVLLGVWSSWLVEPTAAGAAMPASGFIKVKTKTGGDFAAGALTGIGATATGADVVGWIEVRGADTASITVPRLGTFEVVGDWFELGTTNGSRGQVLACPTTATVAGVFPGVQIETSAGSGVYEWYSNVGNLAAASTIPTDAYRGKIVWQTTSGIRIGSDGTNNVGYLPATGCKVRIPNVILTCCTRTVSGSGPRVLPNATMSTRQEFVTTNAGSISMSKCVSQWNNLWAQPFSVSLRDSAFSDRIDISEMASPVDILRSLVAPTQAQLNISLSLVSCFAGGNVTDCYLMRYSLAASGAYVGTFNYITGVNFSTNKFGALAARGNVTVGAFTSARMQDCNFSGNTTFAGRFLVTASSRVSFFETNYIDAFTGTTTATNGQSSVEISSSDNILVAAVYFPLTNLHPYNALVGTTSSFNITVRDMGSRSAFLTLGSANATGNIVNSGGNNSNIKVQRCYCSNTRTGLHAFVNSDTNVTLESVFGDFADTTADAQLNSFAKGCGRTMATTGQSSTYGTHWMDEFTSNTAGRIVAVMNEPTAASAAQCAITSGIPKFNSVGQLAMTVVGQQVVLEMPYFAKGHTATANTAPTLTGTTTGNLTYEFQYDLGTGYNGTWLTLNQTNWFAVGAIDPAIGIRVKFRITCATAAVGNLLTCIRVDTVSTLTAQTDNLYPLDTYTITLTGVSAGTEIHAYRGSVDYPDDAEEISSTESSGTSFSFEITDDDAGTFGYITLVKYGLKFLVIPILFTSSDVSIPIFQVTDRDYANPV